MLPRIERSSSLTHDLILLCRRNFRVLVPGAGLGRLAWDVANLGQEYHVSDLEGYADHVSKQDSRARGTSSLITCFSPLSTCLTGIHVAAGLSLDSSLTSCVAKDGRSQQTYHLPIRPLFLQQPQHRSPPPAHLNPGCATILPAGGCRFLTGRRFVSHTASLGLGFR